jgi:AbiV family abortive infection protein
MFFKGIRSVSTDKALLSKLVRGAQKTFENAEALFREASLLREAGFLCRALFLYQISLEECAKIEILGACATGLLAGHEINLANVRGALISHARKNKTNAYFLEGSSEEEAAKEAGDVKGAVEAFSKMQGEFHRKANAAKNASLYVDFSDEEFSAPVERITPEMVAEIATLNERFLSLTFPKVEMLRMWEMSPERRSEEFVRFEKRIYELAAEHPGDPFSAMEQLLKEMLEAKREATE